MTRYTRNFVSSEFACPCCGQAEMYLPTIARLQELRTLWGKPIVVVEGGGYRCAEYEKSETSAHREGRAIDPAILQGDLWEFLRLAQSVGFTGIGVKNMGGHWQAHIDDAHEIPGVRPRPYLWTY